MSSIHYNRDNWLFPNQPLQTHDISYSDILYLLNSAIDDDERAEDLCKLVQYRDNHPEQKSDYILDQYRIMGTDGTIIQYPFGGRIITFSRKLHLFRGENQDFPCSVPTLRRKTMGKSKREEELMRIVANMRIWQFAKFVWKINVVPYWEARISDVNYKALAQHYGFDTYLVDLTNDFRVALFFATCKYIPERDEFRPLTAKEVEGKHKYGIIYHAPNWILDYCGMGQEKVKRNRECNRYGLDNGDLDGIAFQIGYQPLMRCHCQSGYIYPLRYDSPLNEDRRFERMRFKQSVELSEMVFRFMDGGKKVFPQEGISGIKDIVDKIKRSTIFSMDDLLLAYDFDMVNKIIFPTAADARMALEEYGYQVSDNEVEYDIEPERLNDVNEKYNGKNLLEPMGGMIHWKPEDKRYRDVRCMEIYGKMV